MIFKWHSNSMENNFKKSIEDYIRWSPVSLVIRETCRMYVFNKILAKYKINDNSNILDAGCGDGRWWKYINKNTHFTVYGVDINSDEIEKAKNNINAKVIDIAKKIPSKEFNIKFDLVIGNCSMEHIPDIDSALENLSSSCVEGALVVIFIPTPYWAHNGKIVSFLDGLSPRFSMAFSGAINGFFQHWHLYNYKVWKNLLKEHNLEVVETIGIGNARLEFLFRLFLPTGFIAFIVKKMTGKYSNFYIGKLIPQKIINNLVNKIFKEVKACEVDKESATAFEYAIIARKK